MAGLKPEEERLLAYLKRFVLARSLEGFQVGVFTGLIGELSACKAMGADWDPSTGYDALYRGGTISIKTRRWWKERGRDRSARMGAFRPDATGKYNFSYGWYVELGESFDPNAIWQAPKQTVIALQERAGKTGRGQPRGITLRWFKKRAKLIWPQNERMLGIS